MGILMYFIPGALVGALLGILLAKRKDLLAVFRGQDGKLKDKKVLLFLSVVTIIGSFCYVQIKHNVLGEWAWVFMVTAVILSFLAPDAFVKAVSSVADGWGTRGPQVINKLEETKPRGPGSSASI